MNDKKRYIVKKIYGYNFFIDTKTNEKYFINKYLVYLLNNQDDQINELEERNKTLNRQLVLNIKYKKDMKEFVDKLYEENKQLKKSQKQFAINVLEELQTTFSNSIANFSTGNFVCGIVKNKVDKLKDN